MRVRLTSWAMSSALLDEPRTSSASGHSRHKNKPAAQPVYVCHHSRVGVRRTPASRQRGATPLSQLGGQTPRTPQSIKLHHAKAKHARASACQNRGRGGGAEGKEPERGRGAEGAEGPNTVASQTRSCSQPAIEPKPGNKAKTEPNRACHGHGMRPRCTVQPRARAGTHYARSRPTA